jgi:hypothetical protein
VTKNLPARPNLDHLRCQAKALLAALESGDAEAVSTILNHLPSARGMTANQVRQTRFRLIQLCPASPATDWRGMLVYATVFLDSEKTTV